MGEKRDWILRVTGEARGPTPMSEEARICPEGGHVSGVMRGRGQTRDGDGITQFTARVSSTSTTPPAIPRPFIALNGCN